MNKHVAIEIEANSGVVNKEESTDQPTLDHVTIDIEAANQVTEEVGVEIVDEPEEVCKDYNPSVHQKEVDDEGCYSCCEVLNIIERVNWLAILCFPCILLGLAFALFLLKFGLRVVWYR